MSEEIDESLENEFSSDEEEVEMTAADVLLKLEEVIISLFLLFFVKIVAVATERKSLRSTAVGSGIGF